MKKKLMHDENPWNYKIQMQIFYFLIIFAHIQKLLLVLFIFVGCPTRLFYYATIEYDIIIMSNLVKLWKIEVCENFIELISSLEVALKKIVYRFNQSKEF